MDVSGILNAVNEGNADEVASLIKDVHVDELNAYRDENGYDLLMHVCKMSASSFNFGSGTNEKVKNVDKIACALIEKGVSVHGKLKGLDYTAAFFAAMNGYVNTVKKMYEAGADFTIKTRPNNDNALDACLRNDRDFYLYEEHSNIALFILTQAAKETPEKKKLLIGDLNTIQNSCVSPVLLMALKRCDLDIASFMIDNAQALGVDLKAKNARQESALSYTNALLKEAKRQYAVDLANQTATEDDILYLGSWTDMASQLKKALKQNASRSVAHHQSGTQAVIIENQKQIS